MDVQVLAYNLNVYLPFEFENLSSKILNVVFFCRALKMIEEVLMYQWKSFFFTSSFPDLYAYFHRSCLGC